VVRVFIYLFLFVQHFHFHNSIESIIVIIEGYLSATGKEGLLWRLMIVEGLSGGLGQ
jgi:hypothetical protein